MKTVNAFTLLPIIAKKAMSYMFDRVLNTPPLCKDFRIYVIYHFIKYRKNSKFMENIELRIGQVEKLNMRNNAD